MLQTRPDVTMKPLRPALALPGGTLLGLLVGLTLLRLAVAAVVPLAPDEAYYWIWSRALAPGYPDHPPMVALWIRLGTMIAGQDALGVRLLGPLSAALGTLLLADAAERLFPARNAGPIAAALLNATLLFGAGTVIMTPDTPLLFFWTAALWAAVRTMTGGQGWWLVLGLFAGFALASKYTAVLLVGGAGLWMLVVPLDRRKLLRPAPWLALLIAVSVFLPVLWWNADHGWVSFLRQGGRVADWAPDRAMRYLNELVWGQIGLATPLVFVLCAAGAVVAAQHAWRNRDPAWTLLALLILPGVLVFVQHAFGDRVQGNWPAVLYPAAAVAAAGLSGPMWQRWFMPAVVLGFAASFSLYAQAAFSLMPLPPKFDPVARELAGWDGLASEVAAVAKQQGAAIVIAPQYAVASELAWEMRGGVRVIGDDPRWELFELPPRQPAVMRGLLIWPASGAAPAQWPEAELAGYVERPGAPDGLYRLYRVNGRPSGAITRTLPHRP